MMKELMSVLDPMRRGRRLWDTYLFRRVKGLYSGWKTRLKRLAIVVCGTKSGVDSYG